MADSKFLSLVQMLDHTANRYARKVAIVFGSKKITYGNLQEITLRIASALYKLGIREKDKACLWLPNCPEFVYSYFAILRLGATVVPINSMFKIEEAKFVVNDAGAKILICSIDKIDESEVILARVDCLRCLVCVPFCNNKKVHNLSQFIKKESSSGDEFSGGFCDVAEILYTSGTTGRPKGACLTHLNILTNIKDASFAIKVTAKDCFLCILPLFHSFASTICMLLPVYKGSKIVIMRTIRPFKRVIRTIFRNRVSIFVGVPSLYKILADTKFPWYRIIIVRLLNPIRLCVSGAAALPKEILKKFQIRFKRLLLEGYGLTEASPVVAINPLKGKKKPGSVGVAFPSVEVKIVNKQGKVLPCGEVGELIVKGKSIMKGYYRLEEETRKALRDGWLYTGDLAKVDEEGYIYIVDRAKDMINVRGLNVYPKEIEDLLYMHSNVKEAAVVGVCHRHRGEVPLAFIVSDGNVKERELIRYMRSNLASYKVPMKVIFKENLPKNVIGKILKKELREEVKDTFKSRETKDHGE